MNKEVKEDGAVHSSGGDIASVRPSSPSLLFPRIMSHPTTHLTTQHGAGSGALYRYC
jgi:hypothetical protein